MVKALGPCASVNMGTDCQQCPWCGAQRTHRSQFQSLSTVGVSCDCCTNHHKCGSLKQQKLILSQFWRLEVPRRVPPASSPLWWFQASFGLWLYQSSLSLCLPVASALSPVSNLPPPSRPGTPAVAFRTLPCNLGWSHLTVFLLITSAKTIIPDRVTF